MIYVECWNINVFNRIKYVRRAMRENTFSRIGLIVWR